MTISTEVTRIIVQGDGVTSTFTYTFPITGASGTDQTNAELILTDSTGVSTTLATNLWTISGVVTQPTDWLSGTFTYSTSSPITTGNTLTLVRTYPYEQTTTLSNQGAYSPQVVEAALDDLAMQTEQLNTWRLQSLRAPIVETALVDIPAAADRAGGFLGFDTSSGAQPTVYFGTPGSAIFAGTDSSHTSSTTTLIITGGPVTATASLGTTTFTIGAASGASVPQGRLTLSSATPVMTSDQTAKTTVYYDSFLGNQVPVWNGTSLASLTITADEISLALNTTDNVSGSLYDIFAFSSSGTLTLGTGPAWTNTTTRSAAIARKSGIWTNNATITLRAGGSSLGSITTNQATYLGTIYCTANGQTGMAFTPSASSGGTNNFLGLYNGYNQVRTVAICRDSVGTHTGDSSSNWVSFGGSTSNRISYVDGLGTSAVEGAITAFSSSNAALAYGMSRDSTSTAPQVAGQAGLGTTTGTSFPMSVPDKWPASLGFHFIQGQENALGGAGTWLSNASTPTRQFASVQITLGM